MAPSRLFHATLTAFYMGLSASAAVGQISVVGQLVDDRFIAPGARYDGSVMIRNDTDAPQEVKVYQTDYTFRFDGMTVYGEPGESVRSNARWISFTPSRLQLDPRATGVVHYAVAVPESTALGGVAGSYWSMLMIEGVAPGSPESSAPRPADRNTMGISQLVRYGLQIASHITGTGKKEVRFLDVRIQTEPGGSRLLIVDVENVGEVWFRSGFSAEIFDSSGNSKGTFQGSAFRMYPGTSVRQQINLGGLSRGKYTVVLLLDAGGEDVFGAEYSLML